ncbi:MAG: NAD(P)-binding domain-containing protein, partial [Pyrinomonadaceae bacterium]|nr:NAD(P)-binding domain-containing protein [Pyrinomonadaceae bacterium]
VGIIGTGGAAKACIYGLKNEGADVTLFARDIKNAEALADEFGVKFKDISALNADRNSLDCLINATPLGTIGELENQTPIGRAQLKNLHLAYDLVYNPIETRFLREAKNFGVPAIGGLEMFIAQGRKQFEIWTGLAAPEKIMRNAALQRLK